MSPFSTALRVLLPIAALGLILTRSVWGQNDHIPSDASPEPPAVAAEEEEAPDLPPGVQPPRPVPEIRTMVKELEYQRPSSSERADYTRDRRAGRVTNRAAFDKVVKWMVYRMTDPREFYDLDRRADDILNDLKNSDGQFRDELVKKLVELVPDLFDNRLAVRFNAMRVIANLQDERGVPLMAREIQNPDQHPAVKHIAVLGIEKAPPMRVVANKDLALRALVDLLKNDDSIHGWTRAAAARAIGKFRQPRTGFIGQDAEIVDTLMKLVTSPEGAKHYPNQCYASQAARAIGMLEIEPGLNVDFARIAVEIARLSARMGEGYLKDSQAADERGGFPDANWKVHFEDLYAAFHGVPRLTDSGLLNMAVGQQEPTVKEAATLVTELYLMIGHRDHDDTIREQIDKIKQWVAPNAPAGEGEVSEERVRQVDGDNEAPAVAASRPPSP